MNYFERHLGDYARDAGHLSMLEHGAYTLLLDRYYTTEHGIPADQVHRICRARTRDEKAAVDTTLREFFSLVDGSWVNGRAEREITKMQAKVNAARANGLRGGRPKLTKEEPSGLSLGSFLVTQTKAHQSPVLPPVVPQGDGNESEPGKATPTIPCPYQAIVEAYHELLPSLPKAKLLPDSRQRAMRKVWGWVLSSTKSDGSRRASTAEEAISWLRGYFERAALNDFLMGRTPRSAEHANWQCDLDFLLTDKGMKQVIEKTQDAA